MKTAVLVALSCALIGCAAEVLGEEVAEETSTALTRVPVGDCAALATLTMRDTTITSATLYPAGANPAPVGTIANPICRVVGVVAPKIGFEVWLPTTTWNGKLLGTGSGGLAGSIFYSPSFLNGVAANYATVNTDLGHQGDDTAWFSNPQQVADFGYRATHVTTVVAKKLIKVFFGKEEAYSYWSGCSQGGRQGLMEAYRYPDDYDGIVAGAAANEFTRLNASDVWRTQAALLDPASALMPKLAFLTSSVVAACDGLDGVVDGVMENPQRCTFDPESLLCAGADSPTCLTAAQVVAAKKIYAGPKDPTNGEQIFPGATLGSEPGWEVVIAGPNTSPITTSFYSFMVFQNPAWDWRTFDFHTDWKFSKSKLGDTLDVPAELNKFRAKKGKLLMWHGWNDPAISAQSSVDYYNSLNKKSRGRDKDDSDDKDKDFARLFMVPGMGHCFGGPGATVFQPTASPLVALANWVENGIAPTRIVTLKVAGGAVVGTHPLCPYPQVAVYDGTGNPAFDSSYTCGIDP